MLFIFGAKYLYLVIIAVAGSYFLMQARGAQKQIALLGAILLPLTYLAAKIAGMIYYNPRPFVQTGIASLIPHVADNGFPSDHTLICAAITLLIYAFHKKLAIGLGVLTILVGLSRVAAGVHHLVDVLGSLLIALAVFIVIKQWVMPLVTKSKLYKKYLPQNR